MPIDADAEKAARTELGDLQIEWKKIIETLRDIQVSPNERKYYRNRIWEVHDGFRYRYSPFISIELYREAIGIFDIIDTDLDLALRKGQENYEKEKHKRRIEWAQAIGLGAIILVIIFLIGKLVFKIEIPIP